MIPKLPTKMLLNRRNKKKSVDSTEYVPFRYYSENVEFTVKMETNVGLQPRNHFRVLSRQYVGRT